MKIKEILSQNRRDFKAIYECEHCDATRKDVGYDDRHFHTSVIPDMECKTCGKKASSDYAPRATRYPDAEIV